MSELRFTTVLGGRIAYRARGEGPVVLLVHGAGRSGDVFRHLLPALSAAGFRAVAPDLPGCGRSDKPLYGHSVPELVDRLAAFSTAEHGVPWAVVGEGRGVGVAAGLPRAERSVWFGGPRPALGRTTAELAVRAWALAGGPAEPERLEEWRASLHSRGGRATALRWLTTPLLVPGWGTWVCAAWDPFRPRTPPDASVVPLPGPPRWPGAPLGPVVGRLVASVLTSRW